MTTNKANTANHAQRLARIEELSRIIAETPRAERQSISPLFGEYYELISQGTKSRHKAEGANDVRLADGHFTYINSAGKKTSIPVEIKSGGGCIQSMLRGGGNKSRFVVYYYHVDNKLAHRSCAPIIVPKDTFMNYFINVNPKAAKLRGGNNAHSDDLMIQVTNKAFYEACENWPIPYSPDTVYTAEDFEYLEFGLC